MKTEILIAAAVALSIPTLAAAQQPKDGGRMFAMVDANGDGKLDKAEVTKMMEMRAERRGDATLKSPEKIDAFIKRADANGDGALDKSELAAMRKARATAEAAE
ncbi:EF-hand domain-containing protein [Sphingopyxis sp. H115]|uniref:EF-hand domain-containing protein n=1 Tax=Sphingopyxis sp. H115 TaxID=1759073 RepID=UPI000A52D1F2|nr:EF-hand domain-containing protein [Sphingopyxis sp. H115]